jgi:hypothetical protein
MIGSQSGLFCWVMQFRFRMDLEQPWKYSSDKPYLLYILSNLLTYVISKMVHPWLPRIFQAPDDDYAVLFSMTTVAGLWLQLRLYYGPPVLIVLEFKSTSVGSGDAFEHQHSLMRRKQSKGPLRGLVSDIWYDGMIFSATAQKQGSSVP